MEWLQKILEIDKEMFLYLNSFHNDYWDTIMLLVTRKETWLPFYGILVYFFVRKYNFKSVLIVLFLALTILASDQISVLLKDTIQRLRPVHEPALEGLVHNVLRKGGMYGFVSSHAANTFAIFIFTASVFKNRSYSVLLFFWAVLMSYSRIYSGVHYPLDILGGAILGMLLGFGFFKSLMFVENHFFIVRLPRIEKTNLSVQENRIILLVFAVLVATVFIMSYILHHYGYL